MPINRFDVIELKSATKTDEGFILDTPVVSRTGVFDYLNEDGSIRREYRPPEEVFNADSLASLKGKPITVEHPDELVTDSNAKYLTIGTMLSEGRKDGENLVTDIVIHSPSDMGNRRGLSLGYSLDLEETPGEINGERYDAIQRNIRYNHLSIVKNGRAGAVARLNMDKCQIVENQPEESKMPKVRLDNGIEYEVTPEVEAAFGKLRKDNADLQTKAESTQAKADALQARVDSFPSELDKVKREARVDAEQRIQLEATAKQFNVDCAGKTNIEVKKAIIVAINKDADLSNKSDAYIDARFDVALETVDADAMSKQRQAAFNADKHEDKKSEQLPSAARRDSMVNGLGKVDNK